MEITFSAQIVQHSYTLSGETVNGIDLSSFSEGALYVGNEDTRDAGIYNVERRGGVLYVTLGQCGLEYECEPVGKSHDWAASGEWIDAADYDPERRYIKATAMPDDGYYVRRNNGWTVARPKPEPEDDPAELDQGAPAPEPLPAPAPDLDPGPQPEPSPDSDPRSPEPA